MKRFWFFGMIVFLITLITVWEVQAQTSSWSKNAQEEILQNGKIIHFTGVIDSVDTLTSKIFTLTKFDAESFYTYPLTYNLKLAGGTVSTQKISVELWGTLDGTNWKVIDTLSYRDSSTSLIATTANLNNLKYPKIKVHVFGGTSANALTGFVGAIYAYKED